MKVFTSTNDLNVKWRYGITDTGRRYTQCIVSRIDYDKTDENGRPRLADQIDETAVVDSRDTFIRKVGRKVAFFKAANELFGRDGLIEMRANVKNDKFFTWLTK